ncbi:hypothetical protein JKP88DRAFT_264966 [Tribonema minus]|uniref:EF-hand domain-containing protein n=1 Tax=Tribonema minus TaxID=303371 RepID=A0A836C9J2_9STRA|nr:hypothetical protein JKP88DRAFT_264966 [Tribonema minus]
MSEPLSVISSGSTGKPTLAPHEQAEAQATLDELRASAVATAGERPIRIQAVTYDGDAPAPGSWIVHFMRHGIGEHNVWGAEWAKAGKPGNAYSDPLCPEDAHLTPLGRSQAAQAQPMLAAHLGAVATAAAPAVVYVSPLRRAVETALEATRGLPVRLVAHEGLHEQGGLHHCDRRLTKTELAAQFPAVDFALVEHEHDPTWDADAREPSAHGHVLTFEEFKDGLGQAFGGQLHPDIVRATFDLFDTVPRTWQLDFDEFCAWLDTGKRGAQQQRGGGGGGGGAAAKARPPPPVKEEGAAAGQQHGRRDRRLSAEQLEREQLKAHLLKHKDRLHAPCLTDAQKGLIDIMLLERIKKHAKAGGGEGSNFDTLSAFRKLSRGAPSGKLQWEAFRAEMATLMKHLTDGDEVLGVFKRMDNNGDGAVDLSDFMVWVEKVSSGRSIASGQNPQDYWALEEEEHLRQLKDKRLMCTNPLVPDDYDGSTWIARLNRQKSDPDAPSLSQVRPSADSQSVTMPSCMPSSVESYCAVSPLRAQAEKARLDELLRQKILSKHWHTQGSARADMLCCDFRVPPAPPLQVKGGSFEMLRAFRHFRPAGAGRRLFLDYAEFRDSIKQNGLGLSEMEMRELFAHFDTDNSGKIDYSLKDLSLTLHFRDSIKQNGLGLSEMEMRELFAHFDTDNSGEIDYSEFRQWLEGKEAVTGLRRVSGGQYEVLRAFRNFKVGMKGRAALLNEQDFNTSIKQLGIKLSDAESKALFQKFDEDGSGMIDFAEFRSWVTASATANTGLLVEGADHAKIAAAQERSARGCVIVSGGCSGGGCGGGGQSALAELHTRLRARIAASMKAGPHEMLRAFRRVTRKQTADIVAPDLRDALVSLRLSATDEQARQLFARYDRRARGAVSFQELIETILDSEALPPPLTPADLEALAQREMASEEELDALEQLLRAGLERAFGSRPIECFAAMDPKGVNAINAAGLRACLKHLGVTEPVENRALQQLLARHAAPLPAGASPLVPRTWDFAHLKAFLRTGAEPAAAAHGAAADQRPATAPALQRVASAGDAAAAAAAALEALSGAAAAGRGGSGGEDAPGSRGFVDAAEIKMALQMHGRWRQLLHTFRQLDTRRTGWVSQRDFDGVLKMTHAAHGMGPTEIAAYIGKHARDDAAAPGGRAVAYADFLKRCLVTMRARGALGSAGGSSSASVASRPLSQRGYRSPAAAAAAAAAAGRARPATAAAGVGGTLSGCASAESLASTCTGYSKRITNQNSCARVGVVLDRPVWVRGRASGGAGAPGSFKAREPGSSGGGGGGLPSLGVSAELPRTQDIHRLMRADMLRVMGALKADLKQHESPYRRGVVSAQDFQRITHKHGLAVDAEDLQALLKAHRHRAQAYGSISTVSAHKAGHGADAMPSLQYNDLLRTVHSAAQLPTAAYAH